MYPYVGGEIIKLCSKCFIRLKNDADLEYHEYIVHGHEPAEKPANSQDQEDRFLTKSEITAIRRCITRAEKGVNPIYKITLVELVCKEEIARESMQEEESTDSTVWTTDSVEEPAAENSSETDETSAESSDESSDESEEPIGKHALSFLREMMKAVVSNQFELKRNMFIDIVDSLV